MNEQLKTMTERKEKFMPGKWDTYVHGEEFESIGVKDQYGQVICECFDASRWELKGLPGISGDEQEANARLIAAAPEMYEMLDAILKALETWDAGHPIRVLVLREMIEEVMKKARGEE